MRTLIRFLKDEEGATVIEYGLIAAIISIAAIAGMTSVGVQLSTVFGTITTSLR